jgi:glycine cleavage system transcriptional repressor
VAQLILTAVGSDRPGLVAQLTRTIHENGASLADSRMVNLRGQFAMLILIDGSDATLEKLHGLLAKEGATPGLKLEVQTVPNVDKATKPSVPYRLKSYSMDQPGIVAKITDVLGIYGVNIEELETRVESAPFAGTPLFLLEAVVTVPTGISVRKLRDELVTLGDSIGCDIDLDAV